MPRKPKMYDPEDYSSPQIVKKINQLYVTVRHEFIEQLDNRKWATVKKGEGIRKHYLNDCDIWDHLTGKRTIGVQFMKDKSKFLSFDIDDGSTETLERIYNSLVGYFGSAAVLCSTSGSKGFHVEVFFENIVPRKVLDQLQRVVRKDLIMRIDGDLFELKQVETRGNTDNRGIKLPLGIHKKTNRRCDIVNQFGVRQSPSTILNIKPASVERLYDVIEINYDNKDFFTTQQQIAYEELQHDIKALPIHIESKNDKAKRIERQFITPSFQNGQRNQIMLDIAVWLKDRGDSPDEILNKLMDWLDHRVNPNLYDSDRNQVFQETKRMIKSIFQNSYTLYATRREISFNRGEIAEVLSVNKKHLQKLYYIMFRHAKFCSDESGLFYMTYEQLEESGAVKKNRQLLKKQILELQKLGKIEIVSSNKQVKGTYKKAPNSYRIHFLTKDNNFSYTIFGTSNEKKVSGCKQLSESCIDCMVCRIFDEHELKQEYGVLTASMIEKSRSCKSVKEDYTSDVIM